MSLPDADEQTPQFAQLKMARLHPSLGKPVVTLPLVALAVVGLALIMFFLLGFESSYSGFSNHYVIEQATQAYKENRFDEAATILERLSISHKLDDEQRTLLSDIYLARSEQRVNRSDYVGAMSDLDKIPSQYSKFVLVTGKRNELAELIKVQQAQVQAQAFSATSSHLKSERNKLRLAAKTLVPPSTNSVSKAPLAISVASKAETVPAATASPSQLTPTPPQSTPTPPQSTPTPPQSTPTPPQSTPTPPQSSPSPHESQTYRPETPASRARPQARTDSQAPNSDAPSNASSPCLESQPTISSTAPSKSEPSTQRGLLKAKTVKITENDQVRYNELLAGYFSQEHKQSSGSSEPPSLKEWIDIGRPKF